LPHWLLVGFACLAFLGIGGGAVVVVIRGTGSTTGTGSTGTLSTSSEGGGEPPAPASPLDLSTLTPTAGDVPTRGNVQLAGERVPHSLVYEKVGNTPSSAKVCESNQFNCVATSYHLEGAYHRLTATLGLLETDSYTPQAHWQVFVAGELAQEGKISTNATVPLSIPLKGKQLLELRTEMEGTFNSQTTSVVWAKARVE
jgi:NPCBM/NEW2 domain